MKKTTIFLFFFLFLLQNINAQHEASAWHFGNELNIDFFSMGYDPDPYINYGYHIVDINPATLGYWNNEDEMSMYGLLFFSDGEKITGEDPYYEIFDELNGTSPTQPVIIFPVETSDDTLFYFFTAPDCDNNNDLKYLTINKEGYNDYEISDYDVLYENTSHKLATIKNQDESGYWIITHEQNSNDFLSFFVDEQGLNTEPIRSNTEPYFGGGFLGSNNRGFLKVSPHGDFVAMSSQDDNKVYIYTFNNDENVADGGVLTFYNSFDFSQPYGLEFSAYENKLYVNEINTYHIYQIDILTGEKELIGDTEYHPGTMQLGPDGKIYHSTTNGDWLQVIHNPSMDAQNCFYDNEAINISDYGSQNGTLPNFCASFLHNLDFTWTGTLVNELTYFNISCTDSIESVHWSFETEMGIYTSSTEFSPNILYTETGTFSAYLTVHYSDEYPLDSIQAVRYVSIIPTNVDLGNDTTICDTMQYLTLSSNVNPNDVSDIIWYRNEEELHTDDIQTEIDINKPGEYSIEVWFNGIDQATFDYITVTLSECQNFSFDILVNGEITTGSTTTQCQDNLTIPLSVSPHFDNNNVCYEQSIENSTFTWFFGDGTIGTIEGNTDMEYTFEKAGEYRIVVLLEDQRGCVRKHQTQINLTANPVTNIREDINAFIGEETKLKAGYEDSSSIQLSQIEFINNSFWNRDYDEPIEIINGDISLPIDVYSPDNDAIIESADDIQYVYLNMEHSWYEDLTIELECPNGSKAHLIYIADPNNMQIIMGEPIISDVYNELVGKTEIFLWNNNATNTIEDIAGNYTKDYMDILGNEFNEVKYIPTGEYKPMLAFTNMTGCPVNGEWKININDDDPADNGYVTSFGIIFNPSLFQNNLTINSIEWSGDYITTTEDSVIYIVPEVDGDIPYNCTISDEISCTYDNVVIVHVKKEIPDDKNIIIPNAFTPNGDGVNDTWQFGNIDNMSLIKVQIFNQTGKIVSEYILDDNNIIGWDGTSNNRTLPSDTYWYIIEFFDKTTASGSVTIIR